MFLRLSATGIHLWHTFMFNRKNLTMFGKDSAQSEKKQFEDGFLLFWSMSIVRVSALFQLHWLIEKEEQRTAWFYPDYAEQLMVHVLHALGWGEGGRVNQIGQESLSKNLFYLLPLRPPELWLVSLDISLLRVQGFEKKDRILTYVVAINILSWCSLIPIPVHPQIVPTATLPAPLDNLSGFLAAALLLVGHRMVATSG